MFFVNASVIILQVIGKCKRKFQNSCNFIESSDESRQMHGFGAFSECESLVLPVGGVQFGNYLTGGRSTTLQIGFPRAENRSSYSV